MNVYKYNVLVIALLSSISCAFAAEPYNAPFTIPNGGHYRIIAQPIFPTSPMNVQAVPLGYPAIRPSHPHHILGIIKNTLVEENPLTGEIFPVNGTQLVDQEVLQLRAEVNRLNHCVAALAQEQHRRTFFTPPFHVPVPVFFPHATAESNPAFTPAPEPLSQPEKEEILTPSTEVAFMSESVLTKEEAAPAQTPELKTSYVEKAKAGIAMPMAPADSVEKESITEVSTVESAQKKKKKELPTADKKKIKEQEEKQALERFNTASAKALEKLERKDFTGKLLTARCLQEQLEKKSGAQEIQAAAAEKPAAQKTKSKKKKNALTPTTPKSPAQNADEDSLLDQLIAANKEASVQQPAEPQEATKKSITAEERAELVKKMHSKKNKNVSPTHLSLPVAPPEAQAMAAQAPVVDEVQSIDPMEFLTWLNFKIVNCNVKNSDEDKIDRRDFAEFFCERVLHDQKEVLLFEIGLLQKKQHCNIPPCTIQEPHNNLNCSCEEIVKCCYSFMDKAAAHDFSRTARLIIGFHLFKGFGVEQDKEAAFAIARTHLTRLGLREEAPQKTLIQHLENSQPFYRLEVKLQDIITFLVQRKQYETPDAIRLKGMEILSTTLKSAREAHKPSALYWEAIAYYVDVHHSGQPRCENVKPHSDRNCSCQKIHELLKDDTFELSKLFISFLSMCQRGIKKNKEEVAILNQQLLQQPRLMSLLRNHLYL